MDKKTGVIKSIADKGFGFITDTDGNEHFFHRSRVVDRKFDELSIGDKVEFSIGDSKGRESAINVKVIK